ncbi:cryptochrome/photolyase family protein [Halopiger xanaduensis]|uniref:Deoxyribodipyrimidine photo-lyase n=1 Tax=Halopiger xanaduensis (strain DSM 18323 / JCM 14033 / SH-6) TaxID=797210 RepID=F8D8R8_HALXS|nr:deoxyribodipyrimidine photo-lyase [Halopiger xanaduensis]AEH37978.1 Deoxyribodipyrimidine photo-lyase [Halopiger xanaduensis SH-6]
MNLHWHRRDLRGPDNRALARAATDAVVPVFVLDPTVLEYASPIRVACMLEALESLRAWYRERGGDLVIARGEASAVIPRLADEYGADAVSWAEDYSGLAAERDRAVTAALEDRGLEPRPVRDALHHEPGSITPNKGDHYSVFSYFWKKWRDREKLDPVDAPDAAALADPSGGTGASTDATTDSIPSLADLGFADPEATPPTVTRAAARERLESFCSGPIYRYDETRDVPAADATSRLSVHHKWGTIGPREVYAATERALERAETEAQREDVTAFRRQLAFHEFYTHVLAFNPDLVVADFTAYENGIDWRNDPDELAAWKAGRTGYPIVDAGMRQLRTEGWVHNRVRMIVASFLTADLLVDWREGYDWYRQHLADHESANDAAGWQWAASTGPDAQPYFRVFNPMKQGREYDPDAEYVREYVPELADADPDEIHDWHDLSADRRAAVAPDYPAPIVDHAERRERAIAAFERARGSDS